jgi:hypothetical protein
MSIEKRRENRARKPGNFGKFWEIFPRRRELAANWEGAAEWEEISRGGAEQGQR